MTMLRNMLTTSTKNVDLFLMTNTLGMRRTGSRRNILLTHSSLCSFSVSSGMLTSTTIFMTPSRELLMWSVPKLKINYSLT